jgi:hypothetical protein
MSEQETDDLGDPIVEEKPTTTEPSGVSLEGRTKKVKKAKPHYPRPTHAVDLWMNPVKKKVGQKCIFYNYTNLKFPHYCKWSTKSRRCRIRKSQDTLVLTGEGRCPFQQIRIQKREIKKPTIPKL